MANDEPLEGGVLMKVTTEVSMNIFRQRFIDVKLGATVLLPDPTDPLLRRVDPWIVNDGGFDNQGRVLLGLTRTTNDERTDIVGERDDMLTILEVRTR